jgi:acylphosphatase
VSGSTVRRRVVVTGRVQGVFFRDSLRDEAARRGVSGWVRNCTDGTVEGVFEGEAGAVEAAVAWCREGSPRAEVEHVEAREEPVEGLAGFEVRPG